MFGVFGDIILDVTVHAHGSLQIGSDVVGQISYQGGGSAANFATWLSTQKTKVRFLGAIGQDLAGQVCTLELEQYGIEPFLTIKQEPTGTILVFLDEQGERTMVTSRGANLFLRQEDVSAEFFQELEYLHLTAYSLFGSEDLAATTKEIFEQAKKLGVFISLDPSSYALLEEFGIKRFLELTTGADLLFPNLEEGQVLTGKSKPQEIVADLLEYYPAVVLTMGAAGCLCGHKDELILIPTKQLAVLDTTGAGDSFAAGFMAEFSQSRCFETAAKKGHKLAANCVQHYGGRPQLDRSSSYAKVEDGTI